MDAVSMNDVLETKGTLALQISDPVSMLNEIARRYESTERILMEYIDNALDDAEVLYRDHGNSYHYKVKIEVIIDYSEQSVTVRDNCQGMSKETLERIVRNVGESQKRGLTWVNGRFGFGVQAFRAAADVIHFQTKHKDSPHLTLGLQRNQHTGIRGAQPLAEPFPSNTGTGTVVQINTFDNEWFENVTVGSIKQEIESHFERLLARPNLSITVREAGEQAIRCEAFGYRDIPGQDIHHVLQVEAKGETYALEVHLKVADFEVPGRTVRFFARGRRVNYVSEIKSFLRKSAYRTSVWGHPHLLGYIEVGELVRPVITRDDFVRNRNRKIFYEAVLDLEEEIKNALDRINEAQRDTTLNRLEDVLRQVLDRIARQDRRQLRLHTAAQRKAKQKAKQAAAAVATLAGEPQTAGTQQPPPPVDGAPGAVTDFPPASPSEFQSRVEWQNPALNNAEAAIGSDSIASSALAEQAGFGGLGADGAEFGEAGTEETGFNAFPETRPIAPTPGPDDEVKFSYDVETPKNAPKPPRRRRNSFDIQFYDIPPDADGQVRRSYLIDATIYINVAHPDFQERMIYTRLGQPKVTDRLGAYIAATVSIHYKDQFYAKYGYMPERRDLLFDEQVDFIFRLESALREHLPPLEKELARQTRQENAA
jgi:hypothetical protein